MISDYVMDDVIVVKKCYQKIFVDKKGRKRNKENDYIVGKKKSLIFSLLYWVP